METEERTLREVETETAVYIFEESMKLKVGSEEHARAIESGVKLSKAINEDYKVEVDAYHQDLKTDSEIKRDEEEIKVKREQISLEKLRLNRVKGDTKALLGGTILLTGISFWYEKAGYLIPRGVSKSVDSIIKFLKV